MEYRTSNRTLMNRNTWAVPSTSPVGMSEPVAHPRNCRNECPYGKDKAFCFPCMKKILSESKKA